MSAVTRRQFLPSATAAVAAGYADADPFLFDVQEDPFENRSLAQEAPDDVTRLTDALHSLIGLV